MDTPPPTTRELARRLLAASHTASDSSHAPVRGAMLVSDRLRVSLTRFAGADGFTSLLRRALVLASVEVPSLQNVKVGADGHLDGLEKIAAHADNGSGRAVGVQGEAAVAILAHLLGLLVTFIGEPLTLRLVREAWPDISFDEFHSRIEAE